MLQPISRREFIKLAGLSAAASAALAACGQTGIDAPGNHLAGSALPAAGEDTVVASTCLICARGCGLLFYKTNGRITRVERNPLHPLYSQGDCPQEHLIPYPTSPVERISRPAKQQPGTGVFSPLNWLETVKAIQGIWQKYKPGEIAFLVGQPADHLSDFLHLLSGALGGANVLRINPQADREGWLNLMDASQGLSGQSKIPYFDTERAQVVFTFGATFQESWMSRLTAQNAGETGGSAFHKPYWVQFTADPKSAAFPASQKIFIRPGSEATLAAALAFLAQRPVRENMPSQPDLAQAAATCGIAETELTRLAHVFRAARNSLAIPGAATLSGSLGFQAAQAILELNQAGRRAKPGAGIYFTPNAPVHPHTVTRPSSADEVKYLIERMANRQIKAVIMLGENAAVELPAETGIVDALKAVETVVSLSAYFDETSFLADYVFPVRTAFESFGYQKSAIAGDRMIVSAIQPVIEPAHPVPSILNLLLLSLQGMGGSVAATFPYTNDREFLQASLSSLPGRRGNFQATGLPEFWSRWLHSGGWWSATPELLPAVSLA